MSDVTDFGDGVALVRDDRGIGFQIDGTVRCWASATEVARIADGTAVTNLVCPSCARRHGYAHAPGCPRDIEDCPESYTAGWEAARTAFGDLARWAEAEERKRMAHTFRQFADALEKS